jgi:hypothetical protein
VPGASVLDDEPYVLIATKLGQVGTHQKIDALSFDRAANEQEAKFSLRATFSGKEDLIVKSKRHDPDFFRR